MNLIKIIKRSTVLSGAAIMLASVLSLQAAEQDKAVPVEIHTYEELLQVAENPAGSYRLMEHITMEGLPWESAVFLTAMDTPC